MVGPKLHLKAILGAQLRTSHHACRAARILIPGMWHLHRPKRKVDHAKTHISHAASAHWGIFPILKDTLLVDKTCTNKALRRSSETYAEGREIKEKHLHCLRAHQAGVRHRGLYWQKL